MCILDIEQLDSINSNMYYNPVKEVIGVDTNDIVSLSTEEKLLKERNLYSSRRGMLVMKPMDKFYTIESVRELLIEFELYEYLYKTKTGRERMSSIFPNIKTT